MPVTYTAAEKKGNVLIIEDEDNFRHYLEKVVQKEYNYHSASTWSDAKPILIQNNIDIVLLDLRLPGVSGQQIVEKLKEEFGEDTTVIILTAYENDWKENDALDRGVHYYFRKGDFSPEELLRVMNRCSNSKELFRAILECTPDGILVISKGQINHVNDQFVRLWNIPDELIRKREENALLDFMMDQVKDPQLFLLHTEAIYATLKDESDTIYLKDGRVFERYSSSLIRDGKVAGRVWSFKDITGRVKIEEELKKSLREKDVLLQEVHHRVKNNLQILSSLFDLRSIRTKNKESIRLFKDARVKIHTIALIYTHIYKIEGFDKVNAKKYINELIGYLSQIYMTHMKSILTEISCEEFTLPMKQAVPFALVLNELISNCYKHAFGEKDEGKVEVIARKHKGSKVIISVKDNGSGMPEEIDFQEANTLGMKLVHILVRDQLKGDIHITGNGGTEVSFEFEIEERNDP
jgi:PAS domain S-box-containing protein